MAIADVPSRKPDELRRVVRATALLATGAAVHLWLFPFPGVSDHPFLVLDKVTAGVETVATKGAVRTSRRDAGVVAPALTVPTTPGSQANRGRRPAARDRVAVLIETVHPTLAASPIEALPLAPSGVLLAAALEPAPLPHQPFDAVEHHAIVGRTEVVAAADSPTAGAVELRPPVAESRSVPLVVPAVARTTSPVHREAPRPADAPSDERLVSNLLQQYRHAYESLDVSAAQTVWPTVDARALGAAFRQLAGQRVTFDSCGVSVSGSGAQATARCTGQAQYVPKVGGRRAYTASGEWVFDLEKENAAWRIINANANIK